MQSFGEKYSSVEGYPGHHLRIGKLLRTSARFPDAFVRLVPDFFQSIEQQNEHAEVILGVAAHALLRVEKGVQHLPVNI